MIHLPTSIARFSLSRIEGRSALFRVYWDGENELHIAEHEVSIAEFMQVVVSPMRVEASRSSGRRIAFGYASDGRYLACIYEQFDELTVYPVTAYEVV